jgi:hypothetical protein
MGVLARGHGIAEVWPEVERHHISDLELNDIQNHVQ